MAQTEEAEIVPAPICEELIGRPRWEKCVFQDDDPERRTVIVELDDFMGTVVKGRARRGEMEMGATYRFSGKWSKHPKYGRQFHFDSFGLAEPNGRRGTVLYLARAKGIGERRAERIWGLYGSESLETLRNDPERVAREVKGLRAEDARAASEQFTRDKHLEAVRVALDDLLIGHSAPKTLPAKLLKRYGARAADLVRENPFVLIREWGVRFSLADRIYLALGHDPAALERQAHCVWDAIYSASDGSTWHPATKAAEYLRQKLASAEIRTLDAIDSAVAKELLTKRNRRDGMWLAERADAAHEDALAVRVAELWSAPGNLWPQGKHLDSIGLSLSEHQRDELQKAFQARIGILAGRPGTGKTYILGRLISWAEECSDGVAVCAPTGKAAVRVSESLAREGAITRAATIHSTLGVISAEGGWRFRHGPDNPLLIEYLFLDEGSMVDTTLLSILLAALPPECHVLIVGDPYQLSPVAGGAPLRDLIAAGVPHGLLTEIHRNSGRIVKGCKQIAETHRFDVSPALDLEAEEPENLILLRAPSPEAQMARLGQALDSIIRAGRWDAIRDVQVLCAVNKKSKLVNRKDLNSWLQDRLNPAGESVQGNPFRVGDKVICGKNGTLSSVGGKEENTWVANGEQGIVEEVHAKYSVVRLSSPDRLVRVPVGHRKEEGEEEQKSTDWQLAYAITAHKSQGSEWPIVILMADASASARMIVDRHHVYTSLSRARVACMIIGQMATMLDACRKSNMWARKTFLRESVLGVRAAYLVEDLIS